MSIEVSWYDEEKTILIWKFPKTWMWDAFHASHETLNRFATSADNPVSVVVDTRDTVTLPTNVILNVQRAMSNDNSKIDIYIVVGMNLLLRTFYNTLTRGILKGLVQADRVQMNHTFDDALRYIEQHRRK